jgi:hypothetical protein
MGSSGEQFHLHTGRPNFIGVKMQCQLVEEKQTYAKKPDSSWVKQSPNPSREE